VLFDTDWMFKILVEAFAVTSRMELASSCPFFSYERRLSLSFPFLYVIICS